jgi:hypothetical protein
VLLKKLLAAYRAGRMHFFSDFIDLANPDAFSHLPCSLHRLDWVVNSKRPFAGPEEVLRYFSRYTHRVAISNHRLVDVTDDHVIFTWKDCRNEARVARMTLTPFEFIRRFLLHVLPDGFRRIRHFGFLANGNRKTKLAHIRQLLAGTPRQQVAPATKDVGAPTVEQESVEPIATHDEWKPTCSHCGGEMEIVERLPARRKATRRIDTS